MKTVFREQEGSELYDYGKALEKKFHDPVHEAEQQARGVKRDQTQSRKRA